MLATFHYRDGGHLEAPRDHAIGCDSHEEVDAHVVASRNGIADGTERWFYIEWHAKEGA